ncbi:MAG: class I SAM-dependent methyltransferase [Wenzhouxiangellaceae bacterium]
MSDVNLRQGLRLAWRHGVWPGHCPLCQHYTLFLRHGEWNREQYRCVRCGSIPRWRALYLVLESTYPDWRQRVIHESSPSGSASQVIAAQCQHYTASHFFPDQPLGAQIGEFQNQNLEALTLADNSIDLLITQDVFEHVYDPEAALREVARVLKPGGAHLFTIPWKRGQPTTPRVRFEGDDMVHLKEPEYHGNPISEEGSLVITDWGEDAPQLIDRYSGLHTEVIDWQRPSRGIEGECLEIFISRKPA